MESRRYGASKRPCAQDRPGSSPSHSPPRPVRTEVTAERRASTGALEHALQLVGLWFRDLACVAAGAEELVHNGDRLDALREDAAKGNAWRDAVTKVDDTRAALLLNVSEELALEALACRLEGWVR